MLLYKCVTSFESPCNAWNRLLYHLGRIPVFRCTENTFATDDRRMEDSEYTNGRCGIGKLTENFTGTNWKNRSQQLFYCSFSLIRLTVERERRNNIFSEYVLFMAFFVLTPS